jgi:tRNA acetyltransferase TAN1
MVIRDFNLLISTPRTLENEACSEIWFLLGEIGDNEPVVERSEVTGLIVAKTALDLFKVVQEFRRLLKERPEEFRFTLRVVPIEVVVATKLKDIVRTSLELSTRIKENETFRITIEKRHTTLSSKENVEAVAEGINRKVNLLKPDKIVLIEVLGSLTGISLVKPDDILSVVKERLS